ncbi:MAG: inositol monophosphatase [Gammaproteobacteria bacterium RIFCSPHIGHO2_02_FULL_39_13]|nr:MAG: inositol monophosphatase [Gammaproteobacteria bacterium RIFCSPHIGHO2_02_FULL_39_13]OGT49480.1 MAG: inositol monophosphatase [Gammaproteobacteria bacterium RIFCSPHIGHO2_12_FULL_39_24]
MHPMLNIAIQAARQASRIILRFMDQLDKVEVSQKDQNDFVTQVDKMSEKIIITEIQKAYPHHAILAEESGSHNSSNEEYCWIIDPLDGTRNFMHGFPQFAISIAVMKKNIPELGMIYDPIRQELFTATRGQGAYVNSRRMRISTAKKLASALIGTGFPYKNKNKDCVKNYVTTFEKVLTHCGDIRRAGSATLDLAYVAAGRLDGFWESDLKIWDMAAGVLMIKEAGGMISDFHDGELYLEQGAVVAGNAKIHKELLALITDN